MDPVFPRHTGAERQNQGLNLERHDEFPGEGRSPDWARDVAMTWCPRLHPVDVDLSQRSGRDPGPLPRQHLSDSVIAKWAALQKHLRPLGGRTRRGSRGPRTLPLRRPGGAVLSAPALPEFSSRRSRQERGLPQGHREHK